MFKKILIALIAMLVTSAAAFAAGSFDGYVKDVADKTGKSEDKVREDAIDALRRDGKYSEDDLERIGRGEQIDEAKQSEMIDLLSHSESFKAATGLDTLRNKAISDKAGDAFDAMDTSKDDSTTTTEPKKPVAQSKPVAKPDLSKPQGLELDALALGNIAKAISPKAVDAIKSVGAKNYPAMKQLGIQLARRVKADADKVKKGTMDASSTDASKKPMTAALAEKLLVDVSLTPKALEGELAIGDGSYGACLGMATDAIDSLDDLIDGGNRDGKDPKTWVEGAGRREAERFKQDLEQGLARVCALAKSDCRLLAPVVVKACNEMAGAKAL